jgi:hypothetical protein
MEGTVEEAELFLEFNKGLPMFALGATGSGARELLEGAERCYGEKADRTTLQRAGSYPMVFRRIFGDLAASPPSE